MEFGLGAELVISRIDSGDGAAVVGGKDANVGRWVTHDQAVEDAETAQLVARAQTGDHQAFNEIYFRYFDRVYAYLRVIVRDTHEAEDLTQQTFVKVFEALPTYENRGKPFRAWLFTIVRNFALMHLRKHNRAEVTDPGDVDRRRETATEPDLDMLGWISDQDLLLFIERLPLPQLQALVLHYMLDLSSAEIGEILGRSPGDARLLQHRAIAFLKKRLVSLGRDPKTGERSRMRRVSQEAGVLRLRRFALK